VKWFRVRLPIDDFGQRCWTVIPQVQLVLHSWPNHVFVLRRTPANMPGMGLGWVFRDSRLNGLWYPYRWQAIERLRQLDAELRLGDTSP